MFRKKVAGNQTDEAADPKEVEDPIPGDLLCAWNLTIDVQPNPLRYGETFTWTSTATCHSMCKNPDWWWWFSISGKDKDGKQKVFWSGSLSVPSPHGGANGAVLELPEPAVDDFWEDIMEDCDFSQGIIFTAKIECASCKAKQIRSKSVSVTGAP